MDERQPGSESMRPEAPPRTERLPRAYVRRVVAAVGVFAIAVALFLALARSIDVLLVTFAGILLAVFLVALRDVVSRVTRLPDGWALAVVILLLAAAVGGGSALIAPPLAEQMDELGKRLPGIIDDARTRLSGTPWGRKLVGHVEDGSAFEDLGPHVASAVSLSMRGAASMIGFLFVGLFLAGNPKLYVDGLVRLLPIPARGRGRDILGEMGERVRWFLVARAIAMVLIGGSTALALWLLDVPLALLLGLIAGLLTFVPYLGPLAATLPILLVSLAEGPTKAAVAVAVYAIIQWIEGYIFDPLIVQRVVRIPPALTVVVQLLGGVLLGAAGIALATPFSAAAIVVVKRAYQEDFLGDVPSDASAGDADAA
jgi:predicted PurR-regulated permease PerM